MTRNPAWISLQHKIERLLVIPTGSYSPGQRHSLLTTTECNRIKNYTDRWVVGGDISVLSHKERQDFIKLLDKIYDNL